MPIRLNLLAEQLAIEELRRRDPVKRSYWVAGFLAALMLLWSFYLQTQKWNAADQESSLKTKWRSLETNSVHVLTNKVLTAEVERKLNTLYDLATNRFLWGTFLNSLQFCTGNDLELVQLQTKQEFTETPEGKPAQPGGRGTPATATEKISVNLVARYFGTAPEQSIEQFKRKLRSEAYLKGYFTNENSIKLAGFPQRQSNPQEPTKTYTQFTLEASFPEQTRK